MTSKFNLFRRLAAVVAILLATMSVPATADVISPATSHPCTITGSYEASAGVWRLTATCYRVSTLGAFIDTYVITFGPGGTVGGTLTTTSVTTGVVVETWTLSDGCTVVPVPGGVHYKIICRITAVNAFNGAVRHIVLVFWVEVVPTVPAAGTTEDVVGYGAGVRDGQPFVGSTCGFTSTNDPTGQVIQDPNTQAGEVEGGPWTTPGASSVTITCTISVGDGVISSDDTVVSQTTPGSTGVLTSPVTYQAGPGVSVWLCTQVSWTYDDIDPVTTVGDGSWGGFEDDPDGNAFCDEAISVEPDPA